LHPLSKQAASLLLKEPRLGKDFSPTYTTRRTHVAVGQRFYYLEISGARLKIHRKQRDQRGAPEVSTGRPAQSADIQAVINFVKSEIRLNYYLSEEDAKSLVEKLSQNDFVGASMNIRHSIKTLLNGILRSNISNKVKIIHEAMPEMYLENYNDQQEQFAPLSMIKSAVSGISLNAGKTLLNKLIEMLVDKLSGLAHESVLSYFKSKAAEFKQAQAQPEDGVTIKIVWANIAGMSGIKAVINAIRGNLSINSISGLSLPSIPTPEVKIAAGKNFD
jgi:hypothetical protein